MKRSLLLLSLACFSACDSESVEQAPAPVAKKSDASLATRPEASSQPTDNYIYSPVGKRDPFRPYYVDQALEETEKDSQRTLTDLEKLELDQLKLVGIVSGTSTPTAMFEDPDGRGHVVHIGTAMGRNGGRVSKIKKDEVVIMEEYRDPVTNKKIQSPVSVRLPSDEMTLE
jgi:type IV pilus assembly protein PilP